jgi:hypothetical protein
MRTRKNSSLQALLAMVLLIGLAGCADFEQEGEAFCQRNPDRCGQSPVVDTTAPTIIQGDQSANSVLAHETVTFSVTAQDEETPHLDFEWTCNTGTLGTPASTGTTSEITWTPPPCSPAGTVITVTVTVANSNNLSSTRDFTLSTNRCPSPTVSARADHSLALRGDGTLWAWGYNSKGQLGDETTTDRPAPVQVPGLSSVTTLAAGYSHSLALRNDGTVWAWGYNSSGQLGDGSASYSLIPTQALLP